MDNRTAISRIKQGDPKALEYLVKRYQVQAVRAAYLILNDPLLAEDIVQSSFIKATERIHQFDIERPFSPWFYRIVVNDALKLARKLEREISLDEQLDTPTAQLSKMLIDPDPKPEHLVEENELRRVILDAVQNLPPGQRAVIVMRYYLDMSMQEMSIETDRPLSTIKWWLRDARNRLRKILINMS